MRCCFLVRLGTLLGYDVHFLGDLDIKRGDRSPEIEWVILPAPRLANVGKLAVRHPASDGFLYGTTLYDGRHGDGVVFKLAPPARGKTVWPITMIHGFGGEFGANPSGDLTLDGAGDVYITTPNGGLNAVGAVFEFSPRSGGGGNWTTTVFLGGTAAGTSPAAGVIRDASGNLYGVATTGGSAGHGTVFELAP